MKTIHPASLITRRSGVVFVLMLLLVALPSQAKAGDDPSPDQPNLAAVQLAELTSSDLSNKDRTWWQALEREKLALLATPDRAARMLALQSIIFLSTHYPEQADFDRVLVELYDTYRFDRSEDKQIMALTALHAIGDEQVMRQLAQHVRWERNERLRRLTMAALVDYFGTEQG
jgi:hypothetical protein